MSDATTPDPTTDAAEAAPEPVLMHGCRGHRARGQLVVHPTREQYLAVVKALADDGYAMCVDLTAVDYLGHHDRAVADGIAPERFEVVVNLLDMTHRRRIRLRVQVPEADATLPTLFDIHPGTEAMEREVFDMFGIVFAGHPDLTRILMPEDWIGHPLRKDYEVGAIPVQFKEAAARERRERLVTRDAERARSCKPRSRGRRAPRADARGRLGAADERGRGGRSSATSRTTPTKSRR